MEKVETVKSANSDDKTPQTVNNKFDWSAYVGEQNQGTPQAQQGKESENQKSGYTGNKEADLEHLDKEVLKTIQELFGEKPINIQQPKAIFITKLEKILGGKIPPEIFSELVEEGKIITPHTLINTFGGGFNPW